MDKTIADRLADLRNNRVMPEAPVTGQETRQQRAKLPGYDGRTQRMVAISRRHQVTPFEASSAPLEHLIFTGKLLRANETKEWGDARAEAAYAYREDMQKSEIAGLGAQVISDANGGGGNRATLSEHKLFAMQSLGELKDSMGKKEYQLLERVVWKDEWAFNIPDPKSKPKNRAHSRARRAALEKARAKALDEIRMVLDLAAAHYGFTTMGDVRQRWGRQKRGAAPHPSSLGPGGLRKSRPRPPGTKGVALREPPT